ncbi:hypothetical protein L598_001900000490 [Mesorhizobium sp. J18]|nr:hypothetical protein L598_001900000490 [Mesorhizobium sp. J18]
MLRRPRRSNAYPANFLRLALLCLVCLSILPAPLNAAVAIVAAASTSADEGLARDHPSGKFATVAKARVAPIVISGRPGKHDWQAGADRGDPAICVLYTFEAADHAPAWPEADDDQVANVARYMLGARAPPA